MSEAQSGEAARPPTPDEELHQVDGPVDPSPGKRHLSLVATTHAQRQREAFERVLDLLNLRADFETGRARVLARLGHMNRGQQRLDFADQLTRARLLLRRYG